MPAASCPWASGSATGGSMRNKEKPLSVQFRVLQWTFIFFSGLTLLEGGGGVPNDPKTTSGIRSQHHLLLCS